MKVTKDIHVHMFREYDIRGIYGDDLNGDVAYTIGKSFGSYIQKLGFMKTIVGYDNRFSSPILHEGLLHGIIDSGVDVLDLGLVTTPMYYFAKKKFEYDTGVMITASHNPKEYNGFKISFSKLGNAYGELIQDFRNFTCAYQYLDGKGKVTTFDIKKDYVDCLKSSILLGDRKIKVVVDCGNGTGSIVIRDVLDSLGITYDAIYCDSDGNFPHHHPDPSVAKNMIDLGKRVVELGYDFGIGIDGDADRVGIVDENGKIVPTDLYMVIIYRDIVDHMKNKKALFDVKCSKALIDDLKRLGIEPVMYRTGASYTNMMVHKGNFDFGGEYSGHVFFRDKFPGFDDGIYGGLRLLEILSRSQKTVRELLEGIPTYYSTEEQKIAVTDENKFKIVDKVKEYAFSKGYSCITLDGVRVEFEDGWALVRASNTGPNLTLRFEAMSMKRLEALQEEFMKIVLQAKEVCS